MKRLIPILMATLFFSSCGLFEGIDNGFDNCETGLIKATSELGTIEGATPCPSGEPCDLRSAIHSAFNAVCNEEGARIVVELPQNTTYVVNDGAEAGPTVFDQTVNAAFNLKPNTLAMKPKVVIEGNGSTIRLADTESQSSPKHIFFIHEDADVEFRNLSFAMGDVEYNDWDEYIEGNPPMDHCGGAIHNNGKLKVVDCVFDNCSAELGGAIFNSNKATISGTSFIKNRGIGRILPGGIEVESKGGALCNLGFNPEMDITTSFFQDNVASHGAAIYNALDCVVNLSHSNFQFNSGIRASATVFNDDGHLDARFCDFKNETPLAIESSNHLFLFDTKIWQDIDDFGNNFGALKLSSTASLEKVVVTGFRCEGDDCLPLIEADGDVRFEDCTFFNNSGPVLLTKTGEEFNMNGCYIGNNNATVNIYSDCPNIRLTNNEIIDNFATGLILNDTEFLYLTNNILANNNAFIAAGAISMQSESNVEGIFIHNTIYNNPVSEEFGRYELNFSATFSDLTMLNNIIHNGTNNNAHMSNLMLIGGDVDISHNYINSETNYVPNQEPFFEDLFIGELAIDEASDLRQYDITPPAALINAAPFSSIVPTDKNGQARGPVNATPGANE